MLPPPKKRPKNAQRPSSTSRGYPKEVDGALLERKKQELRAAKEPVDLRIYYCKMKRLDSKLFFSSNEDLYVGYKHVAAEGVVSDPVDAVVAMYTKGQSEPTLVPLSTQSGFEALKQSVERFLPDGHEMQKNAVIRVPRRQWRHGDQRSYCSEERVSKNETDAFREIESDGQFLTALANYSVAYKMPLIARTRLEASVKRDRPDSSSSDDESPRRSRTTEVPYRVLELLVGVRPVLNGLKKSSKAALPARLKIEVEIGAPVARSDNGSLQVAHARCLNEECEKLLIDLGTEEEGSSQMRIGPVRTLIKNYAQAYVNGYETLNSNSALYLIPKANDKTCKEIKTTKDLYNSFMKATRVSLEKEDNTTIKCMRFAFVVLTKKDEGRAGPWEQQAIPADASDPLFLSQQQVVASPPGAQLAAAAKRAASRSFAVDTKELVKQLYTDPTSPVYHGLTKEMMTALEHLLHSPSVQKEYALEREEGSDFPLDKLISFFTQNPKTAKTCCNLLPEQGAYPPEANGDAPVSSKFAKAGADTSSFEGSFASVAAAFHKIVETKTADTVSQAGPQ